MIKFSKYNIVVKDNNKYLIFNTISGIILNISTELYRMLSTYTCRKNSMLSKNDYSMLLNNKILADDNVELAVILKNREIMCNDSTTLGIMIHPTLKCNIDCFYCYQKSYLKNDMTIAVADSIVSFVLDYAKEFNLKYLKLSWSGGEPLLAIDKIEYIVSQINSILPKMTVLPMHLISNGILLSDEIAKRLYKIGIRSLQITVDGLYKVHNERRSIKGNDSFTNVIKNIENILLNHPYIRINIRVNIDKTNTDSFSDIFAFFKERYGGKNYSIYPECVINCGKIGSEIIDPLSIMTKRDKVNFYIGLIENNEMDLDHLFAEPHQFCMKKSRYSFAICPDGNIYDCELVVGDRNCTCINIKSHYDLFDNITLNKKLIGPNKECNSCSLLPLCNYGCIAKEGETMRAHCHLIKGFEKEFIRLYANQILR